MRATAQVLVVLFLPALPALAGPEGRLRVIDGDTITVAGQTVRLFGIDAPEVDQTCADAAGTPWSCGAWSADQVAALFDGVRVTCETVDTDRYGRIVGRCRAGGTDIAETIVAAGLALAYRDYSWDYDQAEKAASIAGRGLWSGTFQAPADWRAAQRAPDPAPQVATGPCNIKGNISGAGRIYHQPHNRDYADTRIDETRGERWFCSPAEAEAAGWRPARN
jgi:endonuclease YncB( thermonuclease family)